ncbi:MAG: hypothetical protein LBQ24_00015 [Candidatus Peribacteria bacterium]|nr:hypothetical protein [Candidatus Peribacteria bacterium]
MCSFCKLFIVFQLNVISDLNKSHISETSSQSSINGIKFFIKICLVFVFSDFGSSQKNSSFSTTQI